MPVQIRAAIILGILGILGVLVAQLVPLLWRYCNRSGARVELVNVTINDESEEFPKIDFKLLNVGDQIAFIKKAEFHVTKVYRIPSTIFFPYEVPVSRNYDILLPPINAPYVKSVDISQAIKQDDVDRFVFTLGHLEYIDSPIIYNIYIELIYNEKDKRLRTSPLIFVMPSTLEVLGGGVLPRELAVEVAKKNKQIATEVSKLRGMKTKAVIKLINHLKDFWVGNKED